MWCDMTKKKKITIIISALLVVCVFTVFFVLTRNVYWHNKYFNKDLPNKTDAEYLGVWDTRFLIDFNNEEIRDLGIEIINESFRLNGEISDELKDIIPAQIFEYINPRDFLSNEEYEMTDEDFDLEETAVLRFKNKAIFFYGYSYKANYIKDGKMQNCGKGYEGVPDRLYMEYINDQWTVVSSYSVA
jgi:hypothetical protein